MQYLIWQSQSGWRLSRTDGRTDKHTRAGGLEQLQAYCEANKLEYTIYPLDSVVQQAQVVKWDYWKVA